SGLRNRRKSTPKKKLNVSMLIRKQDNGERKPKHKEQPRKKRRASWPKKKEIVLPTKSKKLSAARKQPASALKNLRACELRMKPREDAPRKRRSAWRAKSK